MNAQSPLAGQRILIAGCGDLGSSLGLALLVEGAQVWGLRRHPARIPPGLQPLQGDVSTPDGLASLTGLSLDYAVVILTPGGFDDDSYRRVYVDGLRHLLASLPDVKRLLFVSSTSVFAQSDGGWVDENSPTAPDSFSGRRLLEAEQLLPASGRAYSVLRFGGIYGLGRSRLIDEVVAGIGSPASGPFSNRIHRDDCVGILHHLLRLDAGGHAVEEMYLGVDSCPAPLTEVKQWVAQQLGLPADHLRPSDKERSRGGNKRCSNARLLASGYRLIYPGYQDGYRAMLAQRGRD